jgi:hypothetical protein
MESAGVGILDSPWMRAYVAMQGSISLAKPNPGGVHMDKKISVASYWLGILCVLMTVIFRGLAALGIWLILVPANGASISYNTFDHAAELFLLLSIAAGLMSRWRNEKA